MMDTVSCLPSTMPEIDSLRSALDNYVDHEAALLAHQLLAQLEDKLSKEILLLEYGRRFCYKFFDEFRALITSRKDDAENKSPSATGIIPPTEPANRFPFSDIHNNSTQPNDHFSRKLDRQNSNTGSRMNETVNDSQYPDTAEATPISGSTQLRHVQASPARTSRKNSPPFFQRSSPTENLLNLARSSSTEDEAPLERRSSIASFSEQSEILPNCQSKSFFRRRLSFRGLNLFHRRQSDAKLHDSFSLSGTVSTQSLDNTGPFVVPLSRVHTPDTPVSSKRNSVCGEVRQTKVEILIEIVREALCTGCMVGMNESFEEGRGKSREAKWEACRLVLAKSQAGYLLQIFSPPKTNKAKKSLFCTAIREAKDALDSDAHRPDCVFVVQLKGGTRYLFRLETATEKRAWVFEMQRSGLEMARIPAETQQPQSIRPRLSTFPPCSTAVYKKQSPVEAFTPPIPVSNNCEVPQWARQTLFRNSSVTEAAIIRYHGLTDGQVVGEVDVPSSEGKEVINSLAGYPGYHSDITRTEASAAVISATPTTSSEARHGRFLVRASETRPGECVITFNAYGKAKHVRIIVESDGQCHIQSMWFDSVPAMVVHFQQHPLPLDSGQGTSDVILTEMVPYLPLKTGRSRSGSVAAGDRPQPFVGKSCRTKGVMCIDEETKGVA